MCIYFVNYLSLVLVESHVTCHESSMTVEVNRSSLPGLHEDHLRLNDPSNTACDLHTNSNSTHIVAVVPLNACGTQIEVTIEHLFHHMPVFSLNYFLLGV